MHLSPRELDKLVLHNAGFLAQKRLARGCLLNHPETVALIATQLLEFIRDGRSVAELMDLGRKMLGRNQVMSGVPEMIGRSVFLGAAADDRGATTSVGADSAEADPSAFVAVTRTRIVWPASAPTSV